MRPENERRNSSEAQKPKLRERIAHVLGVPSDAVGMSDGFMAEIRGRSGVTVKGCRRILSYSEETITLLTRDGNITVAGSELSCAAYFHGAIGIEGRIDGVFFENASWQLVSRKGSSEEGRRDV